MSGKAAARLGQAQVVRATKDALCVQLEDDDEGTQHWVPRSVIHDDSEVYDDKDHATGELVVEQWWAEKKGLA